VTQSTTPIRDIIERFPDLAAGRSVAVEGDGGATTLLVEFSGPRVSDVPALRAGVASALARTGQTAGIEIVRGDWLPLDPAGRVDDALAQAKYAAMQAKRRIGLIEDGSFAILPEETKDSFAYFGSHAKIRTPVEIGFPGHITVGNWVSLGRYGKFVLLPNDMPSTLPYVEQHYPQLAHSFDFSAYDCDRPANLVIGDGTTLGDRYFIICTRSVEFGKHVMSSANLFVSDCRHVFEYTHLPPALLPVTKGTAVKIGDHVWIGINACILEGVTVGEHAVIAANAVVNADVPPYSLVAGAPAKVKKYFRPGEHRDPP
jgi:acetyltransferase-like isoleucine patch superfamily enzyme